MSYVYESSKIKKKNYKHYLRLGGSTFLNFVPIFCENYFNVNLLTACLWSNLKRKNTAPIMATMTTVLIKIPK